MPKQLALLGGSFNPPHIGHFQLAYTVLENLPLEKILFLPCANPPHKPQSNLLPFDLRCELLAAYIAEKPGFGISAIENDRQGPSYTVETLYQMKKETPGAQLYFIMGVEDLFSFTNWYKWDEILSLTNIIAVPRTRHYTRKELGNTVHGIDSTFMLQNTNGPITSFVHPNGCTIQCLDQPILEVSSTMIRQKWSEGRSLDLFLPQAVLAVLEKNREIVSTIWDKQPF